MIQTDPIAFSPSIPLDSTEKLWEWHIPSDRLFFSKGTRLAFGLSDGESPATMAAFFEHIPEGCLQSLCELREGVIGGDRGFLETAYPVENFFVRERLFVLERDAEGRAIRIAGQFEIAPGHDGLSASGEHRVQRAGADLFLELFAGKEDAVGRRQRLPPARVCRGHTACVQP